MLLNFKVKNFRSIKDEIVLDMQASSDKTMMEQTVFDADNVSLLKSVAIYGANASGKSNLLKAFVIFRKMVLESLIMSNLGTDFPSEPFKLSVETEDKPSFFEMTFVLEDGVYRYGFEIEKKKVVTEWLEKEKGKIPLFKRNEQEIEPNKNYFKEATAALKKQTTEKVLFLSLLASNGGEISQKVVQLLQNTNYISGTNRGATLDYSFGRFLDNDKEIAEKMKDFIIKADVGVIDIKADQKMISADQIKNIPDKFRELLFKENSKIAERSLKFLHKKYDSNKEIENQELDFFAEESEGTQQMFALAAPVIETLENGKILFIDEIDSSLHPILCQWLISMFNSKEKNPKNAQLIFSTHDISLLKEDLLRRDQIYFTEKNKKGFTELFSLWDVSEKKNVDFAKRYLEGRYNALPYIRDFEDLKFNK